MERVKIRIKLSFWLFLVVAVVFKQGYFATMYSFAVILHEISHYVVASRLFYHCKEIQLGIFGAVLYGDFQDVAGSDRVKIALAGPMCNLALCLACLALWWIAPDSYFFTESFFAANATMACANMLPCYPLDGGRVLTGVLEGRLGKNALTVTKKLTVAISLTAFAAFAVSLFTGDNLFSLGLFAIGLFSGIFSRGKEEFYVRTSFAVNRSRFLKKGMEKKTLVFSQQNKLSDVIKRMQGNFLYCLEVVNDDMEVVARYSVAQLEQLVLETDLSTPLNQLRKY
ncbi:MAG: hypothetical protein J1F66_05670 [Clostridiales bacterium]|nr:hypothetical protein [Clostridiales bacterium]